MSFLEWDRFLSCRSLITVDESPSKTELWKPVSLEKSIARQAANISTNSAVWGLHNFFRKASHSLSLRISNHHTNPCAIRLPKQSSIKVDLQQIFTRWTPTCCCCCSSWVKTADRSYLQNSADNFLQSLLICPEAPWLLEGETYSGDARQSKPWLQTVETALDLAALSGPDQKMSHPHPECYPSNQTSFATPDGPSYIPTEHAWHLLDDRSRVDTRSLV